MLVLLIMKVRCVGDLHGDGVGEGGPGHGITSCGEAIHMAVTAVSIHPPYDIFLQIMVHITTPTVLWDID